MSADINKWISGDTDIFLATGLVLEKNVLRHESSMGWSLVWRLMHCRMAVALGVLAFVTVVSLVILTRYPPERLWAATSTTRVSWEREPDGPMPAKQATTEPLPTLVPPILNQRTPTPSDPQLAAFLKEVEIWYDQRMEMAPRRPAVPQKALPQHWSRSSTRAGGSRLNHP